MPKRLLMGNHAMALGALGAGVGVAAGYPGTPSTEVLEALARERGAGVYVEWSINEKAALEVAAGAAYAGVRALVTMKQVGLNVASDPLMSLAYIGVKGGMVVLVADDPGPISSQTEQDTRTFARYARLPVFDPTSPEEAYEMMADAFACSEKYATPVLFRPTTRLCHATAPVEVSDAPPPDVPRGDFVKDPKWVIFPRLSYAAKLAIEARNPRIGEAFGTYRFNEISGGGRIGVAASGVSYAYVREALAALQADCRLLKITTPHPFPEDLAARFLEETDRVLVAEELDPVIERELLLLGARRGLRADIRGKLTGTMPAAGENSVEIMTARLAAHLGVPHTPRPPVETPPLPVRPPVLCAGCPHRASFYAIKRAMRGRKAIFSGDIGCYTLGNAKPLDMVDTCLCMGAGVTLAQGLSRADRDAVCFAFVGDSTFFHSGIPGVINAVYNETPMVLVVLDNSLTAMTGGQTHPGIGRTLMGRDVRKIDIPAILTAVGVQPAIVDPGDPDAVARAAREAADAGGVRAIVCRAPCVTLLPRGAAARIDAARCTACMRCVTELGCPALSEAGGKPVLDAALCAGCTLCAWVCPVNAINTISDENGILSDEPGEGRGV